MQRLLDSMTHELEYRNERILAEFLGNDVSFQGCKAPGGES